jgi:phosphohistidine phosphatase SixA
MHKYILFFVFCCLINIVISNQSTQSTQSNQLNKYIYLVRHGEKDYDAEMRLSVIGFKHANCLADYYFGSFPLGKPQYGMAKTSKTIRSIETLDIIAEKMNISTVNCRKNESVKVVAKSVLKNLEIYDNVLLVWENNIIPLLATQLGCTKCKSWNYNPTAKKHDVHLFNSTWVLTYPHRTDYKLKKVKNYDIDLRVYDQNFINNTCLTEFEYTFRQF